MLCTRILLLLLQLNDLIGRVELCTGVVGKTGVPSMSETTEVTLELLADKTVLDYFLVGILAVITPSASKDTSIAIFVGGISVTR